MMRARPCPAVCIVAEPGNGTRYRLLVTQDVGEGGGCWVWMSGTRVFAAGWFGGNDLRVSAGKLGRVDRAAVWELLCSDEAQAVLTENYRRSR